MRQNGAPLVDRGWREMVFFVVVFFKRSRKAAVCVWLSLALSSSQIDHIQIACLILYWWLVEFLNFESGLEEIAIYCLASSDVFSTFRITYIYIIRKKYMDILGEIEFV